MPWIEPASLDVGHGVGGGQACINNAAFCAGAFGGWQDRNTAAFIDGSHDLWNVAVYTKVTGAIANVFTPPVVANLVYAGGGVIAAWGGAGLQTTTGLHLPEAGLMGVGPDGSVAYKPSYQSTGPTVCHELNGDEWPLTASSPGALQLLGNRRAMWMEGMTVCVHNLPTPDYIKDGGVWKAHAAFAGGEWWICYFSEKHGIVLHPFASSAYCYPILSKGDGWHEIAAIPGRPDLVRLVIARHEGEQAGDLWGYDINVRTGQAASLPFWTTEADMTFVWTETATINAPPPVITPPPVIEPPPVKPPIEPPKPTSPFYHHAVYAGGQPHGHEARRR
jgi:hypothetical protein